MAENKLGIPDSTARWSYNPHLGPTTLWNSPKIGQELGRTAIMWDDHFMQRTPDFCK